MPGLGHPGVLLGPPFDYTGFIAAGAVGIDDQIDQFITRAGGLQPSQGIDETDAVRADALAACGFVDHAANQVVHEGERTKGTGYFFAGYFFVLAGASLRP